MFNELATLRTMLQTGYAGLFAQPEVSGRQAAVSNDDIRHRRAVFREHKG